MDAVRGLALCAAIAINATTAHADAAKDESGRSSEARHHAFLQRDEPPRLESYFSRYGHTRLDIPPGHYPSPGECRVWYPGRPPGHQPAPNQCAEVLPGGWLITHPVDDPHHVHVTVYEPRLPGSVLTVGEFEIDSGLFVRVIFER